MANYTIQEVSSTVGATTDISTIPLSGRTLYIIPKTGYVVDRNDFEEPTTLPSNVTSITFSNTSVGSEPGNQVKVVVGLSATTLTSNASIALGIVGDAKLYDQPVNDQGNSSLNYYVGLSEVSRSNSSAQLNSLSGSSVGVLSNQETVKPFSAPKKIGTINFTATAGNHFDTIPTVSKFGHTAYAPASVFTSNSKTIRDSDHFITSVG